MDAGRLTVHVLDTASGRPAAGLPLTLTRLDPAGAQPLGTWRTNADGRVDAPLLADEAMRVGTYVLEFDVAAWQATTGGAAGFYDVVPLRFRITDPGAHVHVPLLLSPFGYTTYRGS